MSNAATRTRSGDRFYNPPAVRRQQQQQQQLLLQQQQRALQKQELQKTKNVEAEAARTDSDDSTLSKPNSARSVSPAGTNSSNPDSTNLDRFMESVTPLVPAYASSSEGRMRGLRGSSGEPFFRLADLWDCFKEWSVYGVGVPLLLNGGDTVKQYYVPSLSGIQLYVDPARLRRCAGDADAESSRETSSAGSSDCEAEKRNKGSVDGVLDQQHLKNSSFQRLSMLREKPPKSSSIEENEVGNSPGQLVFEYLEEEQPHHRKPLYDKVSNLASQFPEIKSFWSCDLLPASWVSVAWYPIYRIPVGPTLQNLDASFLTFHPLSTNTKSKNHERFDVLSGRKFNGLVASSKISLPVFGLASYKLRGSIFTPNGVQESQQANTLLEAAGNRLRILNVNHPDYQFFVSHNLQWR